MEHETGVPLVAIVDDDESVRDSISNLVRSAGYQSVVFASAEAFLDSNDIVGVLCVVLDIRMRGLSGFDVQRRLSDTKCSIPIIFVSAHAEPELQMRALQQGALVLLPKPFDDEALLAAIHSVGNAPLR
jgi:FixJ family two-component response regulator